jgi:hypothetical protein
LGVAPRENSSVPGPYSTHKTKASFLNVGRGLVGTPTLFPQPIAHIPQSLTPKAYSQQACQ